MDWPVRANVFAMGVANGAFSIAAIGSMMALASQGRVGREGVRMGLWGASQAVGFALGGVLGTAAADLMRWWVGSQVGAYVLVFSVEALMFLLAAAIAARIAIPALLPAERGAALRTSPTAHPTSPEPAHERVAPL